MIKVQNLLFKSTLTLMATLSLLPIPCVLAADSDAFIGNWALTIPGGGAGWLGVTHEHGFYDASLLWGGGSVLPVASVFFNDDKDALYVTRLNEVKRKDASGKVIRTQQFTETLSAKVSGDEMTLTRLAPRENGEG